MSPPWVRPDPGVIAAGWPLKIRFQPRLGCCCGVFYARLCRGFEGARDPLDLSAAKLGISCHLGSQQEALCLLCANLVAMHIF